MLNLHEYFETAQGKGILATCDAAGNVDVALYAKPHVIDNETVAFIMCQRTSYENLKSNLNAAYLFLEDGQGYKGHRLYLTKERQETNNDLVAAWSRRTGYIAPSTDDSQKFIVYFKVTRIRPLVGGASTLS